MWINFDFSGAGTCSLCRLASHILFEYIFLSFIALEYLLVPFSLSTFSSKWLMNCIFYGPSVASLFRARIANHAMLIVSAGVQWASLLHRICWHNSLNSLFLVQSYLLCDSSKMEQFPHRRTHFFCTDSLVAKTVRRDRLRSERYWICRKCYCRIVPGNMIMRAAHAFLQLPHKLQQLYTVDSLSEQWLRI